MIANMGNVFYFNWEFDLLYWFQSLHNPILDKIVVVITSLGNAGIFWILLTLVMLIVCKDKKVAWTSALALLFSLLVINIFLKNTVMRARPCWIDDTIPLLDFGTRIPLLGDHISLFALLMAVSMFLYSKVTMQGQMSSNDPNTATMRFMSLWMMPIMMFFICNSLSAGLTYYYLLSNLITMLETWIIKKFFVRPEDVLAKLKETENKPLPKSKWQQRLEEAQKMQRQMAQQQQKNNRR